MYSLLLTACAASGSAQSASHSQTKGAVLPGAEVGRGSQKQELCQRLGFGLQRRDRSTVAWHSLSQVSLSVVFTLKSLVLQEECDSAHTEMFAGLFLV